MYVVQHCLECLRMENWDMLNLFLENKSNVCSLFDDFYRKYVNICHFCTPLTTVKQSKSDKAGTLLSWLVVKIEYSTCIQFIKIYLGKIQLRLGLLIEHYLHLKVYRNELIMAGKKMALKIT